jgi:hypothetical protein
MSVFHLRDIISGNRMMIKSKDIRHVHVPQFTGLSVENMLEYAKKYPKVFKALPAEQAEIESLHRGYVANVIYTVVGDNFQEWIEKKLKERTKKLCTERDMNITMDPEIYKIFKNSTSISGKYIDSMVANLLY